jgi:threonine dehydrogenase-like Zn-dependent dehydrogenase
MAADAGARFATALVGGEITVIGVRFGSVREGLRAIADRVVDVESLVERRIRLEDGVDAVQLVESGGKLKILLTMR